MPIPKSEDVHVCSVEGISVTAMVVETLCYTVIIGYNVNHYYAISTYGDVFACWLQNLIICGLLAWYKRPTKLQMSVGAVAFTVFNWWIISGYCGMRVLIAMQVRTTALLPTNLRALCTPVDQ